MNVKISTNKKKLTFVVKITSNVFHSLYNCHSNSTYYHVFIIITRIKNSHLIFALDYRISNKVKNFTISRNMHVPIMVYQSFEVCIFNPEIFMYLLIVLIGSKMSRHEKYKYYVYHHPQS